MRHAGSGGSIVPAQMFEPRFIKAVLSTGLPFGVAMGLFFASQHGPAGFLLGAVSGLVFGLAIAGFAERQRRRLELPGKEYEGEPLLRQGPANHWLGAEARGGWLILTTRRLVFRSHGKNLRNDHVEIALAEVSGVDLCRTMWIVPNGLLVRRSGGGQEQFVVQERGAWLAAVADACRAASSV